METNYGKKGSPLMGDINAIRGQITNYMMNSDLYSKDREFKRHVDKLSEATSELETYVKSRIEK